MSLSYWDINNNYIRKWGSLTSVEKARAIKEIKNCTGWPLEYLLGDDDAFNILSSEPGLIDDIGKKYLCTSYHGWRYYNIVSKLYKVNPQFVKSNILSSKDKTTKRALLLFDGLTLDEEILGLRALSGKKYAPNEIREAKYKPSKEAVKKLPPIMRLGVMEALAYNVSYNMFENFNSDEFKELFFASVTKHRDRVESICEKYKESCENGQEAEIIITADCTSCGRYSISIKSSRARTATGLRNTRLANLTRSYCALCGQVIKSEPMIKGSTDGQEDS